MAVTLYEVAAAQKTSMEELLGKTLFVAKNAVDGYVEQDGIIYAYRKEKHSIPPKYGLFVFSINNKLVVERRRNVKTYDFIVGIVTLKIVEVQSFG